MKILITSGGTSEKIDQVRAITNQATGHLGKVMAEIFLAAGHQVSLVTGKHAVRPECHDNLSLYSITDVKDLIETLEPLVKTHHVFIHAMAVSDYSPIYMTDFDTVAQNQELTYFLTKKQEQAKVSSEADYQVLFLKKTPKVISLVKTWNPEIQLIGFKLLVNVEKAELIRVARESLLKNRADYILANDLTDISETAHKAYLVTTTDEETVSTREEIAQLLLKKIEEKR